MKAGFTTTGSTSAYHH